MKHAMIIAAILLTTAHANGQTARPAGDLAPVEITLPKPGTVPTPKKHDNSYELPTTRPVLMAPPRTANLALKRPVTSSDSQPIIGELAMITDGDKEPQSGSIVELGPSPQWVQIDLGRSCTIYGVAIWHNHSRFRSYKDVILQVCDEPDFINGVQTIFNNDKDGSAGLGWGKDREYMETHFGKLVQKPASRPATSASGATATRRTT